jgi:hypothetical protein
MRRRPLTLPVLRNGSLPLPGGEGLERLAKLPLSLGEREGPGAQRWEGEGNKR